MRLPKFRRNAAQFGRIVLASVLRDMRTRFGRSYLAYLIAIAWPLSHLGMIFGLYLLTHRIAPVGDDPAIFAFTGLAPYILLFYPARFTAFALLQNKPLLNFPIVHPIHLIVARCLLEFLSACVVFILFITILNIFGLAYAPLDVHLAAIVLFGTLCLGISFGYLGLIAVSMHTPSGVLFVIFVILGMYFGSGAIIPLDLAPRSLEQMLWFNPLYQSVGLLRCAYYTGYDNQNYSLLYFFTVTAFFLASGMLLERLLRAKLM